MSPAGWHRGEGIGRSASNSVQSKGMSAVSELFTAGRAQEPMAIRARSDNLSLDHPEAVAASPVAPVHDFSELWAHREALRQACYRMVGNEATAEDLVQETYLRALSSNARLEEHRSVVPWLATVARRRSIDELRFRRRLSVVDTLPEPATQSRYTATRPSRWQPGAGRTGCARPWRAEPPRAAAPAPPGEPRVSSPRWPPRRRPAWRRCAPCWPGPGRSCGPHWSGVAPWAASVALVSPFAAEPMHRWATSSKARCRGSPAPVGRWGRWWPWWSPCWPRCWAATRHRGRARGGHLGE